MKILKCVFYASLSIWIAGAAVVAAYYELDRRQVCIEREGLLKGFFWCETTSKTMIDGQDLLLSQRLRALKWPIYLLQRKSDTTSRDENIASSNGSGYYCHQFISDIKGIRNGTGNRDAMARIYNIGSYYVTDDNLAAKVLHLARYYYGGNASDEQIKAFGKLATKATVEICINNPSVNFKEALILGAERVAGIRYI